MNDAPPRNKIARPALALAAILAASARRAVIFLAQLARSETGGVLALDSRFYYDLARTLSTGGSFPAGAIDFNPLYPAFLMVVFQALRRGARRAPHHPARARSPSRSSISRASSSPGVPRKEQPPGRSQVSSPRR